MASVTSRSPEATARQLVEGHGLEWVAQLRDELDRSLGGRGIERVMQLWGLSATELGRLFGVSRQAVTKWIDKGVPSDRAGQVADVEAMTDLLERHLKRDRVPAVVRREAPALGGHSLVELVASGQSAEALRLTRRMFTFADVHA